MAHRTEAGNLETSSDDHVTAAAHGVEEPREPTEGEEVPAARAAGTLPITAQALVGTPAQQAAWQDIVQGRTVERYLRAVAETGTRAAACRVVDIDPATVWQWCENDPTLKERETAAKRAVGERVVSRMAGAALEATNEQLLNHPTGPIAVVNWLLPELRPNSAGIQVAVQVNIEDKLTPEQRQRIAATLYEDD